jgi:hypothetical protein
MRAAACVHHIAVDAEARLETSEAAVLLIWWSWPEVTEKPSPQPPSAIETAPTTIDEPEAMEEPPPPAVAQEPPPVHRATAMANERPSSTIAAPAPSGELTDEATAAFDRDTIAMRVGDSNAPSPEPTSMRPAIRVPVSHHIWMTMQGAIGR